MLQRFDIHNAPLIFCRDLDSGLMQHLGVFAQDLIGSVGDRLLCFDRFLRVGHAQRDDHLVLPKRQGIHKRRVDLIGKDHRVGLHQTDLRRVLQADRSGQLQIVQLLLEAFAQSREIIRFLRILCQTGLGGLCFKGREFFLVRFVQRDAAGGDVHGQFLEVGFVVLEESLLHCNVLQQSLLMLFQNLRDGLDIALYLAVVRLDFLGLVLPSFEEGKDALALVRIRFQIRYEGAERFTDLIHISGAHLFQRLLRKIGQSLLCACAVRNDDIGIVQIDLLRKIIDLLHFIFREGFQSEFFHFLRFDLGHCRILDLFHGFQ